MCSGEEVSEIDELALGHVLDVDESPLGSSTTNNLTGRGGDDVLGANDSERKQRSDVAVELDFVGGKSILTQRVLVRVHSEVVMLELFLQDGLEVGSLFQSQGVCLCDQRNHVGDLGQFLEGDDVQVLESVVSWLDKVENAMDSCVFNVRLSSGVQFFSKVLVLLVLDVLENRFPALLVVDLVAKSWGVDHVQRELDVVFHQGPAGHFHFACFINRLIDRLSTGRINNMVCKQRVHQGALSQP
ncbi:hypothetical protein OGAPHI_002969 [Ogataea philodendri]|uniref:Uncharacterized protein n=1 Tax=Ogataea philodendri TaxID=1378263 RepID=A0A9P8P8T7_9ASCO|nr:uncharacterized protein OGAPHI_002969 [Ogataea philodendri]KAH3667320.1 hypothetical protein OGAPHI_002969 [Ogataea philodendri]